MPNENPCERFDCRRTTSPCAEKDKIDYFVETRSRILYDSTGLPLVQSGFYKGLPRGYAARFVGYRPQ